MKMLRAGSVEIDVSDQGIIVTIEEALIRWELAIQDELTELHDARANFDYRFDDPTWSQGVGDLIEEQNDYLAQVRTVLSIVRVAKGAILGIEVNDVE
jgi:hypothetical protein